MAERIFIMNDFRKAMNYTLQRSNPYSYTFLQGVSLHIDDIIPKMENQ